MVWRGGGGGEESLLGKVGFVILAETIVENFYSEHFLMRFRSFFVEQVSYSA